MIAHGLRAHRQLRGDLGIVEPTGDEIEHFTFANGEIEKIDFTGVACCPMIADEPGNFVEELSPSRLMLQQNMVAAFQRYEFRIGYRTGDQMPFGERHPAVIA